MSPTSTLRWNDRLAQWSKCCGFDLSIYLPAIRLSRRRDRNPFSVLLVYYHTNTPTQLLVRSFCRAAVATSLARHPHQGPNFRNFLRFSQNFPKFVIRFFENLAQILFNQGGAIILRVGVQILLRTKQAKNFFGVVPPHDILGVQQLQRDIRRAYRTALPRNMLATIFITGHAFIGL